MRYLLRLTLVLLLALSFTACDRDSSTPASDNESGTALSDRSTEQDATTAAQPQSDPGDTNTLQWWGLFMGDGFSIEFTEFDGESVWFEIFNLRDGSTIMAGTATLYPDNAHMAEYGEISFSLYEDYSAIDVFASENSEWAHLRGQYTLLDENDPYGTDGRGDLIDQ